MTAMRVSRGANEPVKDMDSSEEPVFARVADPELCKKKKKKKKKEKRKRSVSCSTESSSCSTGSKKHKKKKKYHVEYEEPTSKINPIFLRTHNDTNNTIVSVVCEDYDRWNRIKLTKTPGGWRAIPRTEPNKQWSSWDMLVKKGSKSPTDVVEEDDQAVGKEENGVICETLDTAEPYPGPESPPITNGNVESEVPEISKHTDSDSDVEEVPYIVDQTPVAIVDLCTDEEPEAKEELLIAKKEVEEPETEEDKFKCGEDVNEPNVDENHNDFQPDVRSPCIEENFCRDTEDSVDKRFEFLLNELHESDINNVVNQTSTPDAQKPVDVPQDHLVSNCSALMDELEEMCHGIMSERLKIDEPVHKDDLSDIYTFVPSPGEAEPVKADEEKTIPETDQLETKRHSEDSPMNLVMQENANAEVLKGDEGAPLNACELEGLDILWKLPEGTTIHHSKAPQTKEDPVAQPAHQSSPKKNATISVVKPQSIVKECSTPVQEEPLNLGIPKPPPKLDPTPPPPQPPCKFEEPVRTPANKIPQKKIKNDKLHDSKLLELLKTTDDKNDPLAQLKEILNDPDVSVPDPLLVPRERLQALIANPAKEIPKLLIQSHQLKVPVIDADFLVVSLAHLQYLLQYGVGKDPDGKLYQQAQMLQSQLGSEKNGLDPAVLNQMLWLPYLSQLDINRTTNPQELLALMMSYNYPWQQQHTRQQHPPNYDYTNQQHAAVMQHWHYGQKTSPQLPQAATVPKNYDLYKMTQPLGYGVPQQLRPTAPPIPPFVPPRVDVPNTTTQHTHHHQTQHHHHQHQQRRPRTARSQYHFRHDWTIPQTSEASRVQHHDPPAIVTTLADQSVAHQLHQDVKLPNTSTAQQQQPTPSLPLQHPQIRPKLKVRDHLIDPNLRPKFLKIDDPPFPPPGSRFNDQPTHLWHPLFSSCDLLGTIGDHYKDVGRGRCLWPTNRKVS
ncbi:uncharacterized protein LOC106664232 isoform X2 [Cimex lectularius]|uniref:Uncharacterized protein n=1 Tax=Cimex lectularius TaxID=79782 RepID=A0A8I6RFI8_CIMLE|nr:uncharacterized protein LOC106664232 isoform X2 [Cimex lectularius]